MDERVCEDCNHKRAVGFKSPDGTKRFICLYCRDKYPDPTTWLLHDTCRSCGLGERYCNCGNVPAMIGA